MCISESHIGTTTTSLHTFNGSLSRTTQVSRYQKGKTNLDFTEARDSEWRWHQLGRVQVCTSLQTDNHASIPPLSFLQAGCRSCRPTNSVKALKAYSKLLYLLHNLQCPVVTFLRLDKLCKQTLDNNDTIRDAILTRAQKSA